MNLSALLVLLSFGFLSACSQKQVVGSEFARAPATNKSYEGFFDKDEMQVMADELGIKRSVILNSMRSVGLIFVSRSYKIDQKKRDQLKAFYCVSQESRPFFGSLCDKLSSVACNTECAFDDQSFFGTGVKIKGGYFVTARHVGELLLEAKEPVVKFQEAGGAIRELSLQPTKYSSHTMPHDLSVFRIAVDSKPSLEPKIRESSAQKDEPVYGIGFPVLMGRTTENKSYSQQAKGLRISLGRVTNSNLNGDSFCQFTNEDDVTDIEAWKLEANCEHTDYKSLTFKARQEKDPFLTSSDMTFGMSGSPLFDRSGNLIGIGSNVLSNTASNYDPKKNAVYIKAKWILNLLSD